MAMGGGRRWGGEAMGMGGGGDGDGDGVSPHPRLVGGRPGLGSLPSNGMGQALSRFACRSSQHPTFAPDTLPSGESTGPRPLLLHHKVVHPPPPNPSRPHPTPPPTPTFPSQSFFLAGLLHSRTCAAFLLHPPSSRAPVFAVIANIESAALFLTRATVTKGRKNNSSQTHACPQQHLP